jgi:hypothetical protein
MFLPVAFPVDSLCPDSPGWEVRSKHPFDVIVEVFNSCVWFFPGFVIYYTILAFLTLTVLVVQFISEEVQHGPLILFLKDTEKICGNNDSYHGLKSKLKHFPAGAFIIGSQIQPDNRKEKVHFVISTILDWMLHVSLPCCLLNTCT